MPFLKEQWDGLILLPGGFGDQSPEILQEHSWTTDFSLYPLSEEGRHRDG